MLRERVLHIVIEDTGIVLHLLLLLGLWGGSGDVKVRFVSRNTRETVLMVEGILVERKNILSQLVGMMQWILVSLESEVVRYHVLLYLFFFG